MIGKICDNIMAQINQFHNAQDLKKVLLYRLELEVGQRGVIRDVPPHEWPEVHDFTGEGAEPNANV